MLTDPPYNVALGHHMRLSEAKQLNRRTDGLVIENDAFDNEEDFLHFLESAFTCADNALKPGGVFYIWHAHNWSKPFFTAVETVGWQIRECLVWNKSTFAMGRQDYQWKHEPCLYGWKDGAAHSWYSDRKQSTVLEFSKPSRSEMHPTMKPLELVGYQIKNSSKESDSVLDIFGGSGSTLIACEQLNRKCYMCELDEHYCDVIIQRWENLTGKKAELING